MNKIKFYLKDSLYFFAILFLTLILLTFLNYINVISYKVVSLLSFILTIILFLYSGIKTAKKSERKGYRSGLIVSLIKVFIFLVLSLILCAGLNFKVIIYYGILILSGIIGGMLGINFKIKK